jgi:acyl transferase domain-containing protein/acyl-CoA synthetase (AMP-forming)/AMP-acid ligase II/acyl carrier protein
MTRPFAGQQAQSFVDTLRRRAEETPDAIAYTFLEDGDEQALSISYAALDRRARAIGAMLADRGGAGERILLPLPQGLDFLIAFFGCLYAGAVAVPLAALALSKARRSLPRVRSVTRDAQARFAFILEEQLGAARDLLAGETELAGLELLAADAVEDGWAERWRDPGVDRGSLAFLQYTSGSTSEPKGVMVSHGNLLHNSEILRLSLRNLEGSTVVTWLPSFHDMGLIGNHLQAVYAGAPCVFMTPMHFLQQPLRWLAAISRHRGTTSGGPNFAYELCAGRLRPEQREGLDLRSWTTAFNGAEPVRAETLSRFAEAFAPCGFRREAFFPCYGLAEATLIAAGRHDEDGRRHRVSAAALKEDRAETAAPGEDATVFVGCGGPWLGQRLAIVDAGSLAECPPGRVGEIWVSGGSVAQGYWNRPEESEATFRARIAASGGGEGYLRTGDLGFLADGDLCVTGRLKDLIVIRGQNHYPQDVEWTVHASHPAFAPGAAAAFSVEAEGAERLVVVQELKRGAACDLDEAVAAVRRRVAEEHDLELWGLALLAPGSVPKTTSGKVQRRICRAAWLDGGLDAVGLWRRPAEETAADGAAAAVAAVAEVEAWLVERLARRLAVEPGRIDPRQTFASHGVDSAAAVSLAGELGERLGRDLPATLFYEHPTPAAVARFLAGMDAGETAGPAPAATAEEPVAIVGIGCRFPGARGPRAFWQLLRDGVDAISEVPSSRWDLGRVFDPDASAPGKMSSRWGGFLDAVDEFDATHFGISPREAERMDPQQRLLLEVAWEALEDAGLRPDRLRSSATGVFVGLSNVDYARLQLGSLETLDAYAGTGNSPSIAANRLSFFFDFRGPSLAVDTACSSSLVAVHLACQSLRSGECSLAVAGGVNVIVDPALTVVFSKAGLLAPDGRCKVFDSRADGYVRSEGCGLVVLKPLSRALADGDPVYAVIRGSAVNQDGRSNGLTAPSRAAQESVLREACRRAGVAPGEMQYVELHGTGTELGDPIEAMALGAVAAAGRPAERPLAVGSVKSNLGHLEAAAGAAGLIKVALSLAHGEIPPSLHFLAPNPKIPFAELPLAVQTGLAPWPGGAPGLAGVSSFGFGGTNAHVVLAAPPARAGGEAGEDEGWELLPLSARTGEGLDRAAAELASALAADPGLRAADTAWTLQTGRARFEQRRTVLCRGREDAAAALARLDPERVLTRRVGAARDVAFLLPGLGDHYPGMAAGLYRSEPTFRAELDRCCEILAPHLGLDLREALFAAPAAASADGGELRRLLRRDGAARAAGPLDDTAVAQPAVFAVDWSLARLFASWGIEPAALLGYSLGEYVAAALAGVFSLADALTLVARRARLIAALPPGAMLAVPLPEAETRALLGGELSLAAVNGPAACVVAGSPAAVAALEGELAARGLVSVRLRTSHAFHSRSMEPLREAMAGLVAERPRQAPRIPYLSNVTGGWITAAQACDPAYWADHLCGAVRFADGLAELLRAPERVLLEVGPGQTLGSFAQQHPAFAGEPGASVLASLPPEHARQPDEAFLRACLGKLWLQGIEPDWAAAAAGRPRRRVSLPAYPFERQRHWFTAPAAAAERPAAGKRPDPAEWFYQPVWRQAAARPAPAAAALVAGGPWLILADGRGLGEELRSELERAGAPAVAVRPAGAAGFDRLLASLDDQGLRPRRIVHLGGVTGEAGPGDGAEELGYASVAALVRALAGRGLDGTVELAVVADGLFRVHGGEALWPQKATVLGPCLVAPQEHPEIRCRTIDLSAAEVEAGGLAAPLLAELAAEAEGRGLRVALRAGGRWVEELEAVRLERPAPGADGLRPRGVYLITGGLGGVGLAIAAGLARQVRARLVLVGRSEFPEPAEWASWLDRPEEPTGRRIRQLRELEALGAEVLVLRADAADPVALREAVRRTVERFGALHGVVHAAGSVDPAAFRPLAETGEADREAHFAPKVRGVQALAEALAGHDLDFRLLTSSISTVLGGLGFAAYAAANAFLDAFAAARTDGRWLSVDWDGWLAGERRAGGIGASVAAYAMTPEEGADAFLRLVGSGLSGRVVQSTGDLVARRALWARPHPPAPASRAAGTLSAPLGGGELERRIAELWQRALGVRQVGVHDNFFDLGGNSLIGVQLVADLRRELGVQISNVTLFEAPTVSALAQLLGRAAGAATPGTNIAPASRRPFQNADIAIVGMAGRFPGAASVEELWRNLRDGVESISFFSDQELLDAGVDAAALAAPGYVKARPILGEIAGFDAHFFGFSPREAAFMDPQHRIFMECSWQALEDAGYDARQYGRPIGLFAGCNLSSYMLSLYADPEIAGGLDPYQMVIGNDKDSMPTAVSYKLDLKGPSVAVQTHCSTSLVAVHLACQSLLMEECDMAMAGGVSVRVPQKFGYSHQEGGQESPDGHCRSFDAAAGGTVFGDGAGVVVLKRLADALADGDTIRAVIKGSAINNDGSLKVGYTAPSVEGQSQAIQRALARAGVDPATISYVEGHGSATRLGDPIEVAALTRAFRATTGATGFCALGSVKSNVGHLDRASGVTGLIKTVLALENRMLPATLHFREPNPESDLASSPFYVSAETRPWRSQGSPRRAGVNSLGMGGTNAHLVLEEAAEPAPAGPSRDWQLLVLSARTESALETASAALADHLSRHPGLSLADAAHTLQAGRRAAEHRRTVLAQDLEGAAAALRTLDARRVSTGSCPPGERQVAFLFPGLGDHYAGMASELYSSEAGFRDRVDRCCEILRPHLGLDLRAILYPEGGTGEPAPPRGVDLRGMLGRSGEPAGRDPLGRTALSQPAVFVVDYALAGLWMDWGVRPWAMMGYSLGEYVAACLAGVMSLEDALLLVAGRARLIQDTEAGAMLAVPLAEAAVLPLLTDRLSLAAVNGPAVCVVSGPVAEIEALERSLAAGGARGQRLQAAHAFHSALLEPVRAPVAALARRIELSAPRIPFLSNLTGRWITPEQATDPDYWAAHMCEPVRFEDGLRELLSTGSVLLEVGPGQALTSSALQRRDGDGDTPRVALPSLRHRHDAQPDLAFLLVTLGKLWLAGVEVDWTAFRGAERRRRVPLPTYPFERRPYWIDARRRPAAPAAAVKRSDLASWFFTPEWRRAPLPPAAATAAPAAGRWLLFADARGLGDRLAARLRGAGAQVVSVRRGERFERSGEDAYTLAPAAPAEYERLLEQLRAAGRMPSDIVHLWSLDAGGRSAGEAETALEAGFYSLLFLAQAIGNQGAGDPLRVHAVSANACDVLGGDLLNPLQATLLGPCRVLPQEYPNLSCRLIDVDLASPEWEGLAAALSAEMTAEITGDARIAYRGRYRWVERFEPSPLPPAATRPARLRERGVYLITGGLGGLGLAIAEHLARTVQARLVLLSRSGEAGGEKAGRIAALEALGAEVLVVAADVADEAQLAAALGLARERFGAFNGVVHAAGVPGGGLTQRKPRGQAAAVLAPKVRGTLLLDEMLRGEGLDFLALFSSSSSLTGGLGEADYCAANAFLDAFAHRPAGYGAAFTAAINWGPWQWDAWQDDLLQGLPELRERIRRMRDELGISFAEGSEAFARILDGPHPQVAVLPQGVEALVAQVQSLTLESFLGGVEEARAARPRFHRPQLKNPFVPPAGALEPRLAELFQDLLGVDEVGAEDAFFELGGNSLIGLQVVARAQQELRVQLSVADLFTAPTVRSLAALIAAGRGPEASLEAVAPPPLERSERVEGPLTHGQRRLWFLARLEPESPMHNESIALRILGRFHPPAFGAAFAALCERHEVLRSSFAEGEGEPRQLVHPPLPVPLPVVDLRALPEPLRAAELERISWTQVRAPFDLARAPLVRLLLARLAEEENRLLFVIHHIVHDGRSGVILLRVAAALSAAAAGGRPAALPRPAVRYLDFARWEREWLRGEALERPVAAAVRRLAGAPTVLRWQRADRPRPSRQTFRAGKRSFELPADLSRAVAELGPRFQASLFMTALAAFGVLLHFHTGQEDLLVASPVANRTLPGTGDVLGLFANLQVLRLDLAGDPTFEEILLRTRAAALPALACQELPFEQLVERLQPVRDPAHALLVQAHFSLESEPLTPWQGAGISMLPLPLEHGTSPYELDLNLVEGAVGLAGEIVYSSDLFEAGTIARAAGHYEAVLRAAAAAPEIRLSELCGGLERDERNHRQQAARSLADASLEALRRLPRRRAGLEPSVPVEVPPAS